MKDDLVEQCRAKARITRSGRPSEAEEAEAAFFEAIVSFTNPSLRMAEMRGLANRLG